MNGINPRTLLSAAVGLQALLITLDKKPPELLSFALFISSTGLLINDLYALNQQIKWAQDHTNKNNENCRCNT